MSEDEKSVYKNRAKGVPNTAGAFSGASSRADAVAGPALPNAPRAGARDSYGNLLSDIENKRRREQEKQMLMHERIDLMLERIPVPDCRLFAINYHLNIFSNNFFFVFFQRLSDTRFISWPEITFTKTLKANI